MPHTASSLPRMGGIGVKRDRRLAGWTGGSHRVGDKISQQGRERQRRSLALSLEGMCFMSEIDHLALFLLQRGLGSVNTRVLP